jgi:hypothetical protein
MFRALTLAALGSTWSLVAFAKPPAKPRPADETTPSTPDQCARVSASARNEGYGFAHIVTLQNGCEKAVTCEVWTDVDPAPGHTLRAAPGESSDVLTRRGSPASAVSAQSACRWE